MLGIAFGAAVFHYATYDATFSHGLLVLPRRARAAVLARGLGAPAAAHSAALGAARRARRPRAADEPRRRPLPARSSASSASRTSQRRIRALAPPLRPRRARGGCLRARAAAAARYLYRITGDAFANQYQASTGRAPRPAAPAPDRRPLQRPEGALLLVAARVLAVAGLPFLRRTARRSSSRRSLPARDHLGRRELVGLVVRRLFGMRALIDAMPVFALGLAALVEVGRRAAPWAVAVTSLLAVHGMVAYWLKSIPYDGTTSTATSSRSAGSDLREDRERRLADRQLAELRVHATRSAERDGRRSAPSPRGTSAAAGAARGSLRTRAPPFRGPEHVQIDLDVNTFCMQPT